MDMLCHNRFLMLVTAFEFEMNYGKERYIGYTLH